MYKEYTARPETRLFLVLHPNIALSAYVKKTGCLCALQPNIGVRLVKRVYSNIAVDLENLTIGDGAKMLRKFNNFAPSPIVKSRCLSSVGGGCNN